MIHYRGYRQGDLEILREISVRTGHHGEDASDVEDAPELLPAVFLEPYLAFAPDCALVAEDDDGVFGYALGVPDSLAYGRWCDANWWPKLMSEYDDPGDDEAKWPKSSDWLRRWLHAPPAVLPNGLERWPAHGHIDLLPRGQGTGAARTLMQSLMAKLSEKGASGIHLGVSARNPRALRFYDKLGFRKVPETGDANTVFVARDLP